MVAVTRCGVLLALIAGVMAISTASDWNQWRGPERSGIQPDSPKLLDAWQMRGPAEIWRSDAIPAGGDGGFSAPVVANGKVYLYVNWRRAAYEQADDVILCLDETTGTTLWKDTYPGRAYGWGTSSTPCVVDGKVYAVGGNGLYCVDAATGKEIWKDPSVGDEVSSSPVVVEGIVIVLAGDLKGFDAATGAARWNVPTDSNETAADVMAGVPSNAVTASPAVWVAGDLSYVLISTGVLTCVDPRDGTVVWKGAKADCVATPSVSGDYLAVGSNLALYKLTPQKAQQLFTTGLTDRGASAVINGSHVYAFNGGTVRCLDFTGATLWSEEIGGEISSPVLADGKLFVVVGNDDLAMMAASPHMPTAVYHAHMPVLGLTTPVIADGKVFLRLRDGVGCYDLTQEGVPNLVEPVVIDRTAWVATSIVGPAQQVVDGKGQRWSTNRAMRAGDWLMVDMLDTYKIKQVVVDSSKGAGDAARGLQLWVSTDGTHFTLLKELSVDECAAGKGIAKFDVPPTGARYLKLVEMSDANPSWWSVFDVNVTMAK